MKDFYKILGTNNQASLSEIKKSFRKKALELHPDRSGKDTRAAFIEVYDAYEVLSDQQRRRRYDQLYNRVPSSDESLTSQRSPTKLPPSDTLQNVMPLIGQHSDAKYYFISCWTYF